jgi:glycosyltransferase involved in cell wall biosynthesis
MHQAKPRISIILPARNEAQALHGLLPALRQAVSSLADGVELIVVDDGSDDATARLAQEAGAVVVRHPYAMGNGAAIKSGARRATGEILVFMDADGQHDPADIPRLLHEIEQGYDMAIGARSRRGQASFWRHLGNWVYNRLASLITARPILDLTSGFRACRAERFREFLALLPNGFSYPTTITMAFLRSGYPVTFIPIEVAERIGRSHLRPWRDGIRFLLIIFRIGALFSPLKVFAPIAFCFAILGLGYYGFTFMEAQRFTNMSALLLSTSVLVFLMGLLSEQVTMLLYSRLER